MKVIYNKIKLNSSDMIKNDKRGGIIDTALCV